MEAGSLVLRQRGIRVLDDNEISSVAGGPLQAVLVGIIVTAAAANIGNNIYKVTTGVIRGFEEEMAKT